MLIYLTLEIGGTIPLCTEPVIVSNIFVAVLYLRNHTSNKSQWYKKE